MTTLNAYFNTSNSSDGNGPKRPTVNYQIVSGLDFILSHFKQGSILPRNISTRLTEGRQVTVYIRVKALDYFAKAGLNDCKIAAYPSTN